MYIDENDVVWLRTWIEDRGYRCCIDVFEEIEGMGIMYIYRVVDRGYLFIVMEEIWIWLFFKLFFIFLLLWNLDCVYRFWEVCYLWVVEFFRFRRECCLVKVSCRGFSFFVETRF